MAIQSIKQYRQQNGVDILKVFCKPTKVFPEGKNYFYAPSDAIDLVQRYGWSLCKYGNEVYTTAYTLHNSLRFHRELYYFYNNYYTSCIDHQDCIGIDNTVQNLYAVTNQQNLMNYFIRGYGIRQRASYIEFSPQIKFSGQLYYPYSYIRREDTACHLQFLTETEYLKKLMVDNYYRFDFKKYRRGSEDILDWVRTGVISEEEGVYRHILKYADNAWFYLRYGLEDYFRQYRIPVPKYTLDSDGFMVHPITNQKLCPFEYKSKY